MQLARRHLLGCGAVFPALAILPGCQLPGSGPAPREFRLTPKSTFSEGLPTVAWSLGIGTPTADRSVDTNRIARLTGGVELEYFANATWANRPAAMIQTLLLQSFRNSGAIDVVVDDRSDVRPDFVLQTDLRAFQAEQTSGPPDVRAALDAKLVQMPKRDVVGSESFDHTVAAAAGDIEAIVTAFDDALGKALKRLVEWTLATGEAAAS